MSSPEMCDDAAVYIVPSPTRESAAGQSFFPQAPPEVAAYLSPPPSFNAGGTPFSLNGFQGYLSLSMDEPSHFYSPHEDDALNVLKLQQYPELDLDGDGNYKLTQDEIIHGSSQQLLSSFAESNWDPRFNLPFLHRHENHPLAPELLSACHLPSRSDPALLPHSSFSPMAFVGDLHTGRRDNASSSAGSIMPQPPYHLNLQPQTLFAAEMFQSFHPPADATGGTLFSVCDEMEGSGCVYEEGDQNEVPKFTSEMADFVDKGEGKKIKQTERQRRVQLSDRFTALRSLIPNPTKIDRASILGDAIDYIKELLRRSKELKSEVDKKRCGRQRGKRPKTKDDAMADANSSNVKSRLGDPDQRSSGVCRKSKEAEVEVFIVDHEVTIKLVHRKINCLLAVSKALDDLELDLLHIAGGHVGDYCAFLFNAKIPEGLSVHASAIADKLIEVVDGQYPSIPHSTNC